MLRPGSNATDADSPCSRPPTVRPRSIHRIRLSVRRSDAAAARRRSLRAPPQRGGAIQTAVGNTIGINRLPGAEGKTRLVGDVAFKEVSEVAGAITPVPGGVGQMTVACLLVNTLRAACAIHALPKPGV